MFQQLMTSRRFAPIFWCQLFSALNDNFLKNALVIIILYHTATGQSGALVTLAGGLLVAPFLVFSALGGELADKYGAVAGDWESGAIAYTCARNKQRVVILRGISDLVHAEGGEAYGNMPAFEEGARIVMQRLLHELPGWLERMP